MGRMCKDACIGTILIQTNQLTGEPEVRGPWEGGSGNFWGGGTGGARGGGGVESPRALLWSSGTPDPGVSSYSSTTRAPAATSDDHVIL